MCYLRLSFYFPFLVRFFRVVRVLGCQSSLISLSSMSSLHLNVRLLRWDVSAGDARLYFMYDLSGRSFSASVDVSPVIPLDYVLFCSRVFGGVCDFEAWNVYDSVVTPGVNPLTDGWLPVFLTATLMMLAYSYSFSGEFSSFLDEGFYLLVLSEVIQACVRCGVD